MASSTLLLVLASLGSVTLLRTLYSVINFITFHILPPAQPLIRYKRPGPEPTYALITGASAGLGLGIAQGLMELGFGVILLGHLPDELASAATRLRSVKPDAAVRTLVLNAQTATPTELESAVHSISDLRITILVNNVGGQPVHEPLLRALSTYNIADVDAMMDLNARFMARLTALMLPVLSRPGGRSLVLNLSSAGKVGLPYLVMYSATKSFSFAFSHALARELAAEQGTKHVDCLALVPGDVRTQSNSDGLVKGTPEWDTYGRMVVRKVDGAVRRGWKDVSAFWMHGVQIWLVGALPEVIRTKQLTTILTGKKEAYEVLFEKTR